MLFDFENSIRRSRTETTRYEFKQGILRLTNGRETDNELFKSIVETICAIANVGPDADGFVYIGIVDKAKDAQRVQELDGVEPVKFEHVQIVGVDREAKVRALSLDRYVKLLEQAIASSALTEPLKTHVRTSLDVVSYKGLTLVRVRVPRQAAPSFVGDDCFLRVGSSTIKATGPQIAAVSRLFER